jgi:hypothetical protein
MGFPDPHPQLRHEMAVKTHNLAGEERLAMLGSLWLKLDIFNPTTEVLTSPTCLIVLQ